MFKCSWRLPSYLKIVLMKQVMKFLNLEFRSRVDSRFTRQDVIRRPFNDVMTNVGDSLRCFCFLTDHIALRFANPRNLFADFVIDAFVHRRAISKPEENLQVDKERSKDDS